MVVTRDFFHIAMPQMFSFTCAIQTNNVYFGLLHIYARHHLELEPRIAGLMAIRGCLPAQVQTSLSNIAAAMNIADVKWNVATFMKTFYSSRNASEDDDKLLRPISTAIPDQQHRRISDWTDR